MASSADLARYGFGKKRSKPKTPKAKLANSAKRPPVRATAMRG